MKKYQLKDLLDTILGIILIILLLVFVVLLISYVWSSDENLDNLIFKIAQTNAIVIIPTWFSWMVLGKRF